jgi:cell division protein FtsN
LSAYSEEAVRIPVVSPPPAVPPPTAGEELRETEATATFPDSLTRKDPAPQPLVKPRQGAAAASNGKGKFMLQAGALKNKEAAESLRGRLEREGYRSKVVRIEGKGRGGDLYKVRIGPHGSREEALKAMKAIKYEMKIDVILLKD